jgi:hypothetical protein
MPDLRYGASIVFALGGRSLSWPQMMSEWIDNSFGAGANRVQITYDRTSNTLVIEDDGLGCDDLVEMESPARSKRHAGDRAGRYGIGGVMSQIVASQKGFVEVFSVTATKTMEIAVDWGKCLAEDRLYTTRHLEDARGPRDRVGTKIVIHTCRRLTTVSSVVRDLGYRYSGELSSGKSIVLDVNGETISVHPYEPPEAIKSLDGEFDLDGNHIRFHCRIVGRSDQNPYSGWSVHWGYRFLDRFSDPAEGLPTGRIYAEVCLPETWKNISDTKDAFLEYPETLWAAVAERCRPLVQEAARRDAEVDLTDAGNAVADIINKILEGDKAAKAKVKGRRPGDGEKTGTVVPENPGRGGRHRRFSESQPDADGVPGVLPAIAPVFLVIGWDSTMDVPYRIEASGVRKRTYTLTLNSGIELIRRFVGDQSLLLAYCLFPVALEIANESGRSQNTFPSFQDMQFRDIYGTLLTRASGHSASMMKIRR